MKVISKEVTINEVSFEPVMRLTVEIPLEIMRDGVALMGEDEVKRILGSELFDVLSKKD